MTEYIDHAAKARKLLARYENASLHIIEATAAQAHATLALVEQQRIANLVALSTSGLGPLMQAGDRALLESVPHPEWPNTTIEVLHPEIRIALGLEEA